ncbi:hypothetical protein VZ95_12565 [Elstera litoralis]|uniref:NAD(FAD)-utilizing dehydrogenase n=1 Tax=Elstera litoralis TaxID=552518 RepID=A0A0F3IR80_9PROT|nr:TIGR03862 family flavoprotein [Elstera litoralis]KJV09260.1 hypothetical protein VZ95_12565 [Elstera litoralis]
MKALIVGGGPAGLMAAEVLLKAGVSVDLYDAMPSLGRKFLLAGRGGLNLTHSEPLRAFLDRYGPETETVRPWLAALPPEAIRAWAADLGIETFVGTSGRVFPTDFKAAPLLRAWLTRLRGFGLRTHPRHRWTGQAEGTTLTFDTPTGPVSATGDAVLLALGGASWPHLGSDGAWTDFLPGPIAPLRPFNCGWQIDWSEVLKAKAGSPLKAVALSVGGQRVRGEIILTEYGLEGSALYALSHHLAPGVTLYLDLLPDHDEHQVIDKLAGRGSASLGSFLKKNFRLSPAALALLNEGPRAAGWDTPAALARRLKALPLTLGEPRPLAEAISSAGGVPFSGLTPNLMLLERPSWFVAGEMIDWAAPTGGYLLTACLASGVQAARGMLALISPRPPGLLNAPQY